MNKVVWITGVNGFTGHYMANFLKSRCSNLTIVGLDTAPTPSVDLDDFFSVDISDPELVIAVADKYVPDQVLHFAGLLPPSSDSELWRANVGCIVGLMLGLNASGVVGTRIVSIGSAAEYSPSQKEIDEDTSTNPSSVYGRTKLAQSLLALRLSTEFGYDTMIARPFNLVGPGTKESLVAGTLCSQFSDPSNSKIEVGNTAPVRDFVDVRDAVRAYWAIAEHGCGGEIYNVCSSRHARVSDLVNLFQRSVRREVEIVEADYKVRRNDMMSVVGSYRKLHELTGWTPEISLQQSVHDMIESAKK